MPSVGNETASRDRHLIRGGLGADHLREKAIRGFAALLPEHRLNDDVGPGREAICEPVVDNRIAFEAQITRQLGHAAELVDNFVSGR